MKICIPTINAREQFSEVCEHFGSAPYFTIFDFTEDAYETVNNSDYDNRHGRCHPIENLKDRGIDCVVCEGLGRMALKKIKYSGNKVFRTDQSTVNDIVEDFSDIKLEEIDPENACRTHRCL